MFGPKYLGSNFITYVKIFLLKSFEVSLIADDANVLFYANNVEYTCDLFYK